MAIEDQIKAKGIVLPAGGTSFGAYVPAKRVGNMIYVSGQLPMKDGKLLATGIVPEQCSLEQAREAGKQCVINALAAVKASEGSLDNISGVLRVGAFVASHGSFTQQPAVANGASELLVELFGEAGKHVRAAVGVNVLPLNASVEIEFIFQVR